MRARVGRAFQVTGSAAGEVTPTPLNSNKSWGAQEHGRNQQDAQGKKIDQSEEGLLTWVCASLLLGFLSCLFGLSV
jgi:hypothetical protein